MDPVSALSIASAVVQFIDFAAKLANTYFEVRDTARDQPVQVVRLAARANDLSSAACTAQTRIKSLGASYPHQEQSLLQLVTEVAEVQSKMEAATAKLTVNLRKYLTKSGSRAVVVIRAVWKRSELEEWDRKLDKIRNQVVMSVLMEETRKADTRTERILEAAERIEKAMKLPKGPEGRQENIYKAIRASTAWSDSTTYLTDTPEGLNTVRVPKYIQKKEHQLFRNMILQSLNYEDIDSRMTSIKTAFPDTFQWIFNDERHGFRSWLTSPVDTIYWITGVPASGKSTLMKFITGNEALDGLLRSWASLSSISGTLAQKFRNHARWLYFTIAGNNATPPEWEWKELCECLTFLARHLHSTSSRIVLFVDGLDECRDFAEDNLDSLRAADEMVQFLMSLHEICNVKLCVSSRPLNYFRDRFKSYPSLAMQQFNQRDIDHYIECRLQSSQPIKEIISLQPRDVQLLMQDLKSKARGVFLWVVLVVEQLLLTCLDMPHIKALQNILNTLPADLVKLYDTIQRQISPPKQVEASKVYQIIMEWKQVWEGQMPAMLLWLAAIHGVDQSEYPTLMEERDILQLMKRYLEGHTRGILQILKHMGSDKVDFLHRTAYEWIQREDNWRNILSRGPRRYHPMTAMLAVLASHVRSPRCTKAHRIYLT
ncbi:hypothetical protein BJY04DRAFT_219410 [Aspergillus karnatakaensis]|uniref:uncharacterized protein n=1 Tax=Aspergillus karnatakaensis TaxID=1810916 RepID=UPI003CCD0B9F